MKNRPERIICFLVVWLTMFSCISGQAQDGLKKVVKPDFKHLWLPGTNARLPSSNVDYTGGLNLSWGLLFARSMGSEKLYTIPSNIFYTQSGIICRMEWQVEKATRIPFRFRLGSLADCNVLEGKH